MTEFARQSAADEPLPHKVAALVKDMHPKTVPDVRAGLRKLYAAAGGAAPLDPAGGSSQQTLDAENGLAAFSYLYHDITADIFKRMNSDDNPFTDNHYLTTLDVKFADRYLDALRAYSTDPAQAPKCWAVLFARRSNKRISPLQFVVAGVNAHVNYDLPFAVLSSLQGTTLSPDEHTNFTAVNDIFHERICALRRYFEDSLAQFFDHGFLETLNNRIDDVLVDRDRALAWTVAERLVAHRDDNARVEEIRAHLDAIVANVNRAVLMDEPLRGLLRTDPRQLVSQAVRRVRRGAAWLRRHLRMG